MLDLYYMGLLLVNKIVIGHARSPVPPRVPL